MAYVDDILSLSPSRVWMFNSTLKDEIGSDTSVNTGCAFVATPLCEGSIVSIQSNAVGDRITLPSHDVIEFALNNKFVAGWFMVDSIQTPFTRIYGEGTATSTFQMIMGFGNMITFEVNNSNKNIQIYSSKPLLPGRAYHLAMAFVGNDKVYAWIDGVPQTDTADDVVDYPTLPARNTVGEFSDTSGTIGIGGENLLIVGSVNGHFAGWSFHGSVPTTSQIRQTLFEKGVLPAHTITSDTPANMQSALDALAGNLGSHGLSIRIEEPLGETNPTFYINNIVFHEDTSIHIQWMGQGDLTIFNNGTGNASITSSPSGTVTIVNLVTCTFDGIPVGAEVRIYYTGIAISGTESNPNDYYYLSYQASPLTVKLQIIADGYEEIFQDVNLSGSNETITVFPKEDKNISVLRDKRLILTYELADNDTLALPFPVESQVTIDWGDGTVEDVLAIAPTHQYTTGGFYQVKVSGYVGVLDYHNSGTLRDKLISVDNLGDLGWYDMPNAFRGCYNLISFNAGYCDVSGVDGMEYFFYQCAELTDVNFGDHFRPSANRSFLSFFRQCVSLVNLDLGDNFTIESTTTMQSFLRYNANLQNIRYGDSWDFSHVSSMGNFFQSCNKLSPLGVADWDIRSIPDFGSIFNLDGFTDEEYSQCLENWSQLPVQSGVTLTVSTKAITPEAEAGRTLLRNTHSWTITDGDS